MNWLINLSFVFAILIFLAISVFSTSKELLADRKVPYLGFASSYIFNYFIACFFIILAMFIGSFNIFLKIPVRRSSLLFYNNLHIFAIYNGALFLIKKYNFTKIRNEIILTAIIQFLCFFSILFCCIYFPLINMERTELFETYPELLYFLFSSFADPDYFLESSWLIFDFIIFLKIIPILILSIMWLKSIGKVYNKKENSFFVKSANHPIFYFIFYETLLIMMPFVDYHNFIELTIFMAFIFTLKSIFSKKLLFWLRHKDMEAIEMKAILRSNQC